MYYYLHGMITMHTNNSVVIECHGVGYDCLVSHPEDYPIGENMFLFVSYYCHEDDQFFVGFKTMQEKDLYQKLISVKGIGPKTALAALAGSSTDRLEDAINNAEEGYLVRLPGIGRKNASQIILDLKGKLFIPKDLSNTGEKNLDLAYDGLKGMGFRDKEIQAAFDQITERGLKPEEYMTKALKVIQTK
ncbi:MAG: Holliday junction branch migration protein RuvA [Bacilli bacterium]